MNIHIYIHTDRSPVRLDTIDDLYWSTLICASVYTYIYNKKICTSMCECIYKYLHVYTYIYIQIRWHPSCAAEWCQVYACIHMYTHYIRAYVYQYGDNPLVLQNAVKCMLAYVCVNITHEWYVYTLYTVVHKLHTYIYIRIRRQIQIWRQNLLFCWMTWSVCIRTYVYTLHTYIHMQLQWQTSCSAKCRRWYSEVLPLPDPGHPNNMNVCVYTCI